MCEICKFYLKTFLVFRLNVETYYKNIRKWFLPTHRHNYSYGINVIYQQYIVLSYIL